MNRTIKEAKVRRFHYDHHDQLRTYLESFVDAYKLQPSSQNTEWAHALRVVQTMDIRASKIHPQSASRDAGTEHLGASQA